MEFGFDIGHVQFDIMDDAEVLRRSVVEIQTESQYNDDVPYEYGLFDERMGTIDQNRTCLTCNNPRAKCLGHFGHISLRYPIFNSIYTDEIKQWLKIICFKCGYTVFEFETHSVVSKPRPLRLAAAASLSLEGKTCYNCKEVHPKITSGSDSNAFQDKRVFIAEYPNTQRKDRLWPRIVQTIFEKIRPEVLEYFGKKSPTRLIINYVLVIPPMTRPNLKQLTGYSSSSCDTTYMYQQLIRANQALPQLFADEFTKPTAMPQHGKQTTDRTRENLIKLQKTHCEMVLSSGIAAATTSITGGGVKNTQHTVVPLLRLLPSKSGILRTGLLSSRTVQYGRSVIGSNNLNSPDMLDLPSRMAKTMKVMETVQPHTIRRLTEMVLNGPHRSNGVSHVLKKSTNSKYDLEYMMRSGKSIKLDYGDVVFRDVMFGDMVVFNRQPTLNYSSIGVHRARPMINEPNIKVFRPNTIVCKGYKADFDGDEMNGTVPANMASQVEAMICSSVYNSFINKQNSIPLNGQLQDGILGAFLLSRDGVLINRFYAFILFATCQRIPTFEKGKKVFTGKEIVSLVFQDTPFNYETTPSCYGDQYKQYLKDFPDIDKKVVFEQGVMLSGVLDKKSIGEGQSNSIFHILYLEYGADVVMSKIYDLQQVCLQFLMMEGFTIGAFDFRISKEARAEMDAVIEASTTESRQIVENMLKGNLVPPLGYTISQYYEQLQINSLKLNEHDVMRVLTKSLDFHTNSLLTMVMTGSRGNMPNVMHLTTCIGQTNIGGNRLRENFSYNRSNVYFPRFDLTPESRGFVPDCYYRGLNNVGLLAQATTGRNDLIAKALTTSQTGSEMRKAQYAMQSCITNYYRQVVKRTHLVQTLYGGNGGASQFMERVNLAFVEMSDDALRSKVTPSTKPSAAVHKYVEDLIEGVRFIRDNLLQLADTHFQSYTTTVLMIVNPKRIIDKYHDTTKDTTKDANLDAKVAAAEELIRGLPYIYTNEEQMRLKTPLSATYLQAARIMQATARYYLDPVTLERLSMAAITLIRDQLMLKAQLSLIEYGDTVGILSVITLLAEVTQEQLDSHHRSVGGSTSKGTIERMQELLGNRVETGGSMAFELADKTLTLEQAQKVAINLEYQVVENVVEKDTLLIIYEAHNQLEYPKTLDDNKWIKRFRDNHPSLTISTNVSKVCFRFVISKYALVSKSVNLETIVYRLRKAFPHWLIMHNMEKDPIIVIRVWVSNDDITFKLETKHFEELRCRILNVNIKGIRGIISTAVKTERRHVYDNGITTRERVLIRTNGTNLRAILLQPFIDQSTVVTTSISQTYDIYGKTAAINKLISELIAVSNGSVNYNHIALFALELFRLGYYTNIERAGVAVREPKAVFLQMGSGDPIKRIVNAAKQGMDSPIYGVAAPRIIGAKPRIGTNYSNIIINEQFVRDNKVSIDKLLDDF